MASLTRWTWVWVNSGSWWWTGRPGMLRFMGSQRVGHDWATDLIWSDLMAIYLRASGISCYVTTWHSATLFTLAFRWIPLDSKKVIFLFSFSMLIPFWGHLYRESLMQLKTIMFYSFGNMPFCGFATENDINLLLHVFSNPKRWCCESSALNMPAHLENSAVATELEKVSFSFQSQRKAMPKNGQITTQLHSSHTLVK